MENPDQQFRRLRDQFIKTLNHPRFDTSTDAEQQAFLREITRQMGINDDAMNALIRQSWNKRGPVPVLRPASVDVSPIVTVPPPASLTAARTIPVGSQTPMNDIFNVNAADLGPAQLLRLAITAHQAQGVSIEAINDHFRHRDTRSNHHRLIIPQFVKHSNRMEIFYVNPQGMMGRAELMNFPEELRRASIGGGQNAVERIDFITDFPGYLDDIRVFLAYINRLRAHLSIIDNVDLQHALRTAELQIEIYTRRATESGQFNQWEYITNMRGWADQLAVIGLILKAPIPVATVTYTPTQEQLSNLPPGFGPRPANPPAVVPGGLLPNFFQTFKVAPPTTGLAPSATANLMTFATARPQQPLSPTATRLAVPFTTFMTAPLPSQPTFVNQSELVYLKEGSKERKQLQKLSVVVRELRTEEQRLPANVRPVYDRDLLDLHNEIMMYLARQGSRGVNLYDYISKVQDFTDHLKEIQGRIAARPVPRYHPDLDPAILYEPDILRQPRMVLGMRAFADLISMQRVLTEVGQDELAKFGRQGVFVEDIDRMLGDTQDQIQYYRRQVGQMIQTEEWLGILRRWRDAIQDLIDQRKALGRRCVNDADPWDGTPVMEIPDNEYIRLSNGMCWHVGSLMEYIRGKEGLNESKGLVGYASDRLWENDDDVKRIMEHPLVVADADFKQYFMNVIYGRMADKISPQTLQMMYITASLFVSRGQPFDEMVRGYLTPEQYEIFIRYAGGDAYTIDSIPVNQQREEIDTAIKLIIKGKAAVAFWDYYDKLSQEEKDAIQSFRGTFERDLRECRFGKPNDPNNKLCVYLMARVILPVVHRVADIKGIPVQRLNTSEQ